MIISSLVSISKDIGDRKTAIIKAVGIPTIDRAINQLQELYQKKLIPEPKYIFTQSDISKSGNPEWKCTCNIDGIIENAGEYIDVSKNKVKKYAAFDTLNALIGRDLTNIFKKHGNITEEI